MDAQFEVAFKSKCEEWIRKCILCRNCHKVPESVWKAHCDHFLCEVCKQSTSKCPTCNFPLNGRSKKSKIFVQENVYDTLIKAAGELIETLGIDIKTLNNTPISKGTMSRRKSTIGLSKKDESDGDLSSTNVDDNQKVVTPEGKFGRKKYTMKYTEISQTPRSKSDKLFEKVIESNTKDEDEKLKQTRAEKKTGTDEHTKGGHKLRGNVKATFQQNQETPKATKSNPSNRRGRPPKRCTSVTPQKNEIESDHVRRGFVKKRSTNKAGNVKDEDFFDVEKTEENKRCRQSSVDENKSKKQKKITEESFKSPLKGRERSVSTLKSGSVQRSSRLSKSSAVLISTSLTKNQTNELAKFRKQFSCKYKEVYDNEVTHVICRTVDQNYTSRTIKYLHGLIGNKWLLSYEWIEDSLKEGEVLDEELYEIKGTCKDKNASKGAPQKSRRSKKKLFEDFVGFFEGKFIPQNIPPKEDLVKLFKSGGGTVVDSIKKLNTVIEKEQQLIVVREDDQPSCATTENLKSVNVADFLSMITEFEINTAVVNFA